MQKPIEHLLKQEMSRKEFLATVGFGAASLLGFSSILQLLGKNPSANLPQSLMPGTQSASRSNGYGGNAYGR